MSTAPSGAKRDMSAKRKRADSAKIVTKLPKQKKSFKMSNEELVKEMVTDLTERK